jgi:predicted polyphosphate/ATP-dependent NAD kinase
VRIGFVVNPIAGMGGRVGLKGTDRVAAEAKARGAEPVAPERARTFLARLQELLASGALAEPPHWLTASGPMGEELLRQADLGSIETVHRLSSPSTAGDTGAFVRAALETGVQLLLFVGGDGTARDVAEANAGRVPVLGVPAGVKMHSAVFANHPEAAADIFAEFAQGLTRVVQAEVLDVDEEAYRRGEWRVRLYALAPTLEEPMLRQVGKMSFEEVHEDDVLEGIARHVAELSEAQPERLFLLGPGSTLAAVATRLGARKTLLGFDAVREGQQVGTDLDEHAMLELLHEASEATLVLSPVGAQGFILGRGNQQASPEVVRRVGVANLLVVATPAKLRGTPLLRVDCGDTALDEAIRARGHLPVLIGWRTSRMMPIEHPA